MAISAAAASPQMGSTGDARISYLLALLNVRLNYWVARPRRQASPYPLRGPRWLLRQTPPGGLYLFKEMTGLLMNERGNYQNLSDGGPVENLALYELLRRRCKFIIAIDGEADPDRTFGGLLTLVRLAYIDLGVDDRTRSGRTSEDGKRDEQIPFSALQKYRLEHPTFPHESTAEQLYDETRFEAYRALGEHVGENLFRPDVVNPIQSDQEPQPGPLTVRQWFQGLAGNLLEPN